MVLNLKDHYAKKEQLITEIEHLMEELKQLQQPEDHSKTALVLKQLETKLQQLSALKSLAVTPWKFMS